MSDFYSDARVYTIEKLLRELILTPEQADHIIATTRARTRARVPADNRAPLEEPVLATLRANITSRAALTPTSRTMLDLLDEIDRLKGTRR